MNFRKKLFLWSVLAVIGCIFIWLLALFLRSPQPDNIGIVSSKVSPIYPDRGRHNPDKGNTHIIDVDTEGKLSSKRLQGKMLPSSNQPAILNTSRVISEPIESLIIEGKYTFETKEGSDLPPNEVPFKAVDANAYLAGPDVKIPLQFISPVGFIMQHDGRIVVINNFSLQNDSDLYFQQVKGLKNLDIISVPVITALYGNSLQTMVSFEVSFAVNGQIIWSYQLQTGYQFDGDAQMRMNTNLGNTFKRLFDED